MNLAANTCRACLLQKDLSNLFDWYLPMNDVNEQLTYVECFQLCTQLNVKIKDEESGRIDNIHYLCEDCVQELRDSYRFIRKAQKSDNELYILSQKFGNECDVKTEEFELVNMQDLCNSPSKSDEFTELILDPKYSITDEIIKDNAKCPKPRADISEVDEFSLTAGTKTTLLLPCRISEASNVKAKRETRVKDNRRQKTDNLEDKNEKLTCEYCNKAVTKNQLKRHISRFHRRKMLLCSACPCTFNDAATLRRHEDIHQTNRERNISCEQCQRKFFTQRAYQNHSKTHDINRQPKYKCDQCEKCFFYNSSLKLHKQLHMGLSFECNVCLKRYARSVDLQIHLRSHSGEQPYKCPRCDKAFKHVQVLNKHVQHHEGHRYKCNVCGKEYAHQSTMLQHRKEHTGLPLKCSICNKGFVKKSKMRRHIGGVHQIKNIEEIDKLILKVKTKSIYRGRIIEM